MSDALIFAVIAIAVYFFYFSGGGTGADDQCKGVSCSNFCQGTTLFHGGICVNGSCVYSQQPGSQQCISNPCTGITCSDYCSGTTLFHNGQCSGGQCSYSSSVNSPTCGYVQPAEMKVAYFCYNSCNSNEKTYMDEFASMGYSVTGKNSDSWTLAELRGYSVMVMGTGAVSPTVATFQTANREYGISAIEMYSRPDNGRGLGYITTTSISSCIQQGSSAINHAITNGLVVGKVFDLCNSPACQSDCPKYYAKTYAGTNVVSFVKDTAKPLVIARDKSGTSGRYVWIGAMPVSMPMSILTNEVKLIIRNSLNWAEAG